MEITREEARQTVTAWNESIDEFMESKLPGLLESEGIPVKNGKIRMNDYIKAMQIVRNQGFYSKGRAIQVKLRSAGYDVKMDMQSDKLILY